MRIHLLGEFLTNLAATLEMLDEVSSTDSKELSDSLKSFGGEVDALLGAYFGKLKPRFEAFPDILGGENTEKKVLEFMNLFSCEVNELETRLITVEQTINKLTKMFEKHNLWKEV